MKRWMFDIYYHLPPRVRDLAATARGYYLRGWRYNATADARARETLARDYSPRDQWATWQREHLAEALHRAATRVPFYRALWQARRRDGDNASWEYLENWPILEKEQLRQNTRAFIAEDCDPRRMYHEHTSGTTGKPLDLWWSYQTVTAWYALLEARGRLWYGVSRHDRWAILGGQLVTPVTQRRPPFWVWNRALNQLYMSSYHLAPDLVGAYLDALERYRIRYLWGYTSSLYALAQEALRIKRTVKMQVAITNAEPVFDYQRSAIEAAFDCPLRETYGMAEIVAAASECEAGHLHIWPEVGIFEIAQGDTLQARGSGDLVCTGLLNLDMPLIRYRVGDQGALPEVDVPCACGRTLPYLERIEGRADDTLYSVDGRRIGRLDPVFKSQLPIREAQIIQETLTRIRVRYVPAPGFTPETGKLITERLQERLGRIEVILERVNEIPRTANGKFRAVISQLSLEERRQVQAADE